jgi:hypothetical protein
MLEEGEDADDLFSLLEEMKQEGLIHNHFGTIHLITAESEARRTGSRERRQPQIANAWCWYVLLPESEELRYQFRKSFDREDGRVFRTLASIVLNERPGRIGEREIGPITEEEGRYITAVNERLRAYLDRKGEEVNG